VLFRVRTAKRVRRLRSRKGERGPRWTAALPAARHRSDRPSHPGEQARRWDMTPLSASPAPLPVRVFGVWNSPPTPQGSPR